jgi:5-methylcytosine-specific restriction protein A
MPRAPRRCPGDDYTCPNKVTTTPYCPDHTKVWGGKRTTSSKVTSTAQWKRLRLRVLKRDKGRCQLRYDGCTGRATQVDHIISTAAGGAELDPNNAHAVCMHCHSVKSQTESRAAIRRQRQP